MGYIQHNPRTACSQWGSSSDPPRPDLSLFAVCHGLLSPAALKQLYAGKRTRKGLADRSLSLLRTSQLLAHCITLAYLLTTFPNRTFRRVPAQRLFSSHNVRKISTNVSRLCMSDVHQLPFIQKTTQGILITFGPYRST